MSSLFISYRRADSPDSVSRLHKLLKARLPRWTLFYDIAVLKPGEDFPKQLRREVTSATVVLVVIGPVWVKSLKERLNQPGLDHVREEVRLALQSGRKVIPVWVDNVDKDFLPTEANLADFPDLLPLLPLGRELVRPDPDFENDAERLAAYLDTLGPGVGAGTLLGGKYKILREIGHGGMGVVFEAEQHQPNRTVAVKMILEGMDTKEVLTRFDGEKEALARMNDPNIARVIDSGVSPTGKPYFVMEFVKGQPITDYCDRKKLKTEVRLELFRQVCSAVKHAHQKGIIHRDIKPSNVLVEEINGKPVPKVIDFGLAKALSGKLSNKSFVPSEFGKTVGTLIYSSPEQAAGYEIDTLTDVYSLGVLLYELLAGEPPFTEEHLKNVGDDAMKREIIKGEPSKPSAKLSSSQSLPTIAANRQLDPAKLTRLVRGDLDWIVLKALQKETKDRYPDPGQLSDDVERYLKHEPVKAGKPSSIDRLKKFVRRNRGAVLAGTALIVVLVAGIIGTTLGLFEARAEKLRADEEARNAKKQEGIALTALGEKEIALGKETIALKKSDDDRKDLKHNLALDKVLLAQPAIENNNPLLAREYLDQVPKDLRHWEWHYLQRKLEGGIFTLDGHGGSVISAGFSPDSTRIVTGSDDTTAKVWDAKTGSPLLDLKGHKGVVTSVGFSPDSTHIVTGSLDKTARCWDAKTGMALLDLTGHRSTVTSVGFSPDGTRIVTGSYDRTAKVWDAKTGIMLLNLKGHTGVVSSVGFSPDGARIVTGSDDATAKVWDAKAGIALLDLKGHTGAVLGVGYSPDGTQIVTGSEDRTAKIWEAKTGLTLLDFKGHIREVISVGFSPDGTRIVTGSLDVTAKVWYAKTGMALLDLTGHRSTVTSVGFSPDSTRIVTGSDDTTAKVWDAKTGSPLLDLNGHIRGVTSVGFSPDGTHIVTGSEDRTAKVWDAKTGSPLLDLKGHTGAVSSVGFSPDSTRIVTGSDDTTAKVWDAKTGSPLLDLKGHKGVVTSVGFSPDGTRIVTGSSDETAKVWGAKTGIALFDLKGHTEQVTSVGFSPDGARIVTGSHDKMAMVWDAKTGIPLLELKGHTERVTSVGFSPDGTRIITGSRDNKAKIWDSRRYPPGSSDEWSSLNFWTRPRPDLHREQFDIATKSNDTFAACFHLDRLLAYQPQERTQLLAVRTKLQPDDWRVQSRTVVHSPKLAKPALEPLIWRAAQWDPLALRLLGGRLLRDGKPTDAITQLKLALLLRANDRPPVEELLLALAYHDAKQPAEAAKWHAKATAWLDRYRLQMQVMSALGAFPVGIFQGTTELFKQPVDPRHNAFDWETWYECEIFRAEVEGKMKGP